MAMEIGKNVRGCWSKYKRLALIFFLYIMLCLISTPSSTWATYTYTELLPPGWVAATAIAINDNGVVIGEGKDGTGVTRGFLYGEGTYTELLPPGWVMATAVAINNNGVILGWGTNNGFIRASFIAHPALITIDIKPGSDSNNINPESTGNIPVAILSIQDFYAPDMVNKESLTFGPTGVEDSLAFCGGPEDVNGDGLKDLVCHFCTSDVGFQCGDTEGILKGTTVDVKVIEGSNLVNIKPCKK